MRFLKTKAVFLTALMLWFSLAANEVVQAQFYRTTAIDISSATTTRLFAGVAAQTPYFLNIMLAVGVGSATSGSVQLVSGNSSDGLGCGTGQTVLTGIMTGAVTTGTVPAIYETAGNPALVGANSANVCAITTNGTPVRGWVTYYFQTTQ